jgi:hypothetical protein
MGDPATLPGPRRPVFARERDRDVQVRVPAPKGVELVAENDIGLGLDGEHEVNVPRPTQVGQVANLRHERRDPHSSSDEHDAVSLGSKERELPGWGANFDHVARLDGVV